jgi:trigger factor
LPVESGKESRMKKKVLLVMGMCIVLLAGGCTKHDASDLSGGSSDKSTTDKSSSDSSDITVSGIPDKGEYNVDDYIKLGNYKGIEVTVDKMLVTDAALEDAITYELENNKKLVEVTDRDVVQNGDVVNIDYEGLKDGKAFEGGTATKQDLIIGSNQFIDGFEKGLIGKKVGEKVTLNLTFPKDYSSKDLAGQAVVFNVTINKIQKYEVSELTEDYVKNNTDYDTIEAYKKAKSDSLEAAYEQTMNDDISNKVMEAVIKDSKISSYPQTLIDYYVAAYKNYFTQSLQSTYSVSLEDYLKAMDKTQEEFDASVKTVAENYASLELVERAIAKAEGLSITDEDYKNKIDAYVKDYSAVSEEDLLSRVPKEEIKDDMLLKAALQVAVDNAKVTKNEVTPSPVPTEAAAQ